MACDLFWEEDPLPARCAVVPYRPVPHVAPLRKTDADEGRDLPLTAKVGLHLHRAEALSPKTVQRVTR